MVVLSSMNYFFKNFAYFQYFYLDENIIECI